MNQGSRSLAKIPHEDGVLLREYRRKMGLRGRAPWGPSAEVSCSRHGQVWDLVAERIGDRATPLLVDAVWRWISERARSMDTAKLYLRCWWDWLEVGGLRRLTDQVSVVPAEIGRYLDLCTGRLAKRTVHMRLQVLRSWLTWLDRLELLRGKYPVTAQMRAMLRFDQQAVAKPGQRRQALTPEEARSVSRWAMDQAPHVDLAVHLMLVGGLRRAEVCTVEARDWVERRNKGQMIRTLTIRGKGDKSRVIPVFKPLALARERYLHARRSGGSRGRLVTYRSRPLTREMVHSIAKKAAAAVGREPEISAHDLRRTAASLLRSRGATDDQVQRFLGHADVTTTLTCYTLYGREMTADIDFSEEAS